MTQNYIERYWRDATPADAIKEPPMVARFRNGDGFDWYIDCLTGIRRHQKYTWYSAQIGSYMHCQVYDAPDPGEGWRLVDVEKEQPQVGDEWLDDNGAWKMRACGGVSGFGWYDTYRRRIEPPKPKYVPFTWEDREQLKGRWIGRDSQEIQLVNFGNSDGFYANGVHVENLCKYWTFLDTGEPVGKKVQA